MMKQVCILFLFVVSFVEISMNTANAQCVITPPDLGPDTSLCQGQSVVLNGGSGYLSYLWDNNSTASTRSVFQSGTYWVQVSQLSGNLVTNGDFEQGNTGISTDYTLGTSGTYGPLSTEGTYAITSSPNLVHSNFSNCADHTPNPGTQMMVVNGSATANTNVWCQTITVTPNTEYQFSTWVSSALNDPNVAQLQFSINGSALGGIFSPSSQGCQWSQFFQTWNSGAATSAQICIVNQNTGAGGNDFAIDDISFSSICYASDTIQVGTLPKPIISVTPNDTICAGEIASITASSSEALTYTWNPGNVQGPTLNVSPTSSTIYNVTGMNTNGCVSDLTTRLVHVSPAPQVQISATTDTLCFGEEVELVASANNANVEFTWSPNNENNDTLLLTPNSSSDISVIATNANGCSGYDTLSIEVIPDLSVSISGVSELCEGDSTELTVQGNIPGMTFEWSTQETNDQITVSPASTEAYTVVGQYLNCPVGQDQITVEVNPIPVVSTQSDVEICAGESITAQANSSVPGSTFIWSEGNSTSGETTLSIDQSGLIYVYATSQGCESKLDSFYVEVLYGCDVEVPNVFSPNDDMVNDVFSLISYEGIVSLECIILNRWGNTVNQFNTPNFAWNGTDKRGNLVPEGTYFYKISGQTSSGSEFLKQGFVELVK